jgi:hypothetical protein
LSRDSRARPGAEASSVRSELTSNEQPTARTLAATLADLRRKLNLQVNGPKGKHQCCLAVDDRIVRPGFIVRYLFDAGSGQKRFGERPE